MVGNGKATEVPKSEVIPGAIGMTQDEYYLLKELAFTQSQRFIFAADQAMWFLLDPTNYTPGLTQVAEKIVFRLPGIGADAGPIFIDFYSVPTLGAAVATPLILPSFNRVGGSAIAAQLELSSLNVAPASLGSPLSQLMVPATATGVGNKSGDSISEALPFIFDNTEPLLMVLTNKDGAGVNVNVRHNWFEI